MKKNTKNRGFASMPKELQRAIASKGGKAIVAKRGIGYMKDIARKGAQQRDINKKRKQVIGTNGDFNSLLKS